MNVLDISFDSTSSCDALSKDVFSENLCVSTTLVCHNKQKNASYSEDVTEYSDLNKFASPKRT